MLVGTSARFRRLEAEVQAWEVAACGGRNVEGARLHEQRQNALCDRMHDNDWDDMEIDALIAAMAEQADLVEGFVTTGLLPRERDLLLLTPCGRRLPMLRQLAQRGGDLAGLTQGAVAAIVRVCLIPADDLDRFSMRRCAGCRLFRPCRKQPSWKSVYEPMPPRLPKFLAICPHCGNAQWEWAN